MQAIYWIKQLSNSTVAILRQWHKDHLSANLARELNLTDALMRADIQILIEHATPCAPPAADMNGDKGPTPTAEATNMPAGGFRAVPLPGLPTHLRYSTS